LHHAIHAMYSMVFLFNIFTFLFHAYKGKNFNNYIRKTVSK
jgi:hypothetical protein